MATRRSHVLVDAPAAVPWSYLRRPADMMEWFPDLVDVEMEGDRRTLVLPTGLRIAEQVLTVDDDLRRFQYRVVDNPIIRDHLATIDVFDLEDGRSLIAYSTEVQPGAIALVLGHQTAIAIDALRRVAEADAARQKG